MNTGEIELYQLLDEILKQGKAKGRKPGEMIDELPTEEDKKNQLRKLINYLTNGPEQLPGLQWNY